VKKERKMTKDEFYEYFKRLPKAELHLHIEAVVGRKTIRSFIRRRRPELDESTLDAEMTRLFDYSDLNGFIASYIEIQNLYDSVDDFDYLFSDLQDYILRNGLSYVEIFAAPSAFLKKGWKFSDMMDSYARNIRKIKAKTGVDIRMLVDVSRTFGAENAERNLELLLSYRIPEVIGIGLGGSEQKGPANLFGDVFERARANGFHAVAHAGEDVGPESVWDTLNILKAERIGHGISSVQDDNLMKVLFEKQIPLEVCPTSNVFTKKYVQELSEHPIIEFFDRNLLVTLNTDDPLFFGVELLDEYWKAYNEIGFSVDDLKKIARNSFKASFLSEEKKSEFIALLDKTN
jgi:adenosine deaminase